MSRIEKMFARRQFTECERQSMRELYDIAKVLATRIDNMLEVGVEKELAILKVKEVLAFCEGGVAMQIPNHGPGKTSMCDKAGGPATDSIWGR